VLESLLMGVAGLVALAAVLVIARGPLFGTRIYRPMLLNLALSVTPLVVLAGSIIMWAVATALGAHVVATAIVVVCAVVWLLALPNAAYLVTELNLNHRRPGEHVPEWYDVLLVLVLAMSGVLSTVLNVFLVQLEYTLVRSGDTAAGLTATDVRVLVGVVLVLVSFGVWLGRNVRVNSWDVVRPWRLAARVVAHLRTPGTAVNALGFTVVATAFFATMYLVVIGPVIQGLIAIEQARGS